MQKITLGDGSIKRIIIEKRKGIKIATNTGEEPGTKDEKGPRLENGGIEEDEGVEEESTCLEGRRHISLIVPTSMNEEKSTKIR